MESGIKKWEQSIIRKNMKEYREAVKNFYIQDRPLVEMEDGNEAFSLLSPPLGSNAARRRVRLIMKNIVDEKTSVEEDGTVLWGDRTPHFITISVTYKCQCNCAHCSASSYKKEVNRNKNALSVGELKSVIKQTIDLGTTCVVFTGGEPFLYEHLDELVKTVDGSKSICTLFTNGEFLENNSLFKLKKAGLFGVFVSLDYADPKKHDEHRQRKGLFQKAVRGIKLCQEKGILTGISTVATKEKIASGELDRMMDLARELNVLEVFIFDVIATGRLKGKQSHMLDENDINYLKKFREKYNSKPKYPRIIHQTMFTRIAYPCAAEGCPGGVAQMHIRGDGDVTPCDFNPLSFGNIRQQPLKEIWRAMTESEIYSQSSKRCRLSDQAMWDKIKESNCII